MIRNAGKISSVIQTQLNELSSQYSPDLLWFDGDWEHTSEEWKAPRPLIYSKNIIRYYHQFKTEQSWRL
jgi:hypothetical protein